MKTITNKEKAGVMVEISWCEYWCGDLTDNQKAVTIHRVQTGEFVGVGRAVGSMKFAPLIALAGKNANIIDRSGYMQLAAVDGRKEYTSEA